MLINQILYFSSVINFDFKDLITSLERKKEFLRQKREQFKPIRMKDLVEHEKAYEERLKSKLKERKEKREKWYRDIGYGDYDPSKFKSKYLSSFESEERITKDNSINSIIEKLDK